MNTKKTMTLNMSKDEMEILIKFSKKWDMSKTAVVRRSIRLMDIVEGMLQRGEIKWPNPLAGLNLTTINLNKDSES